MRTFPNKYNLEYSNLQYFMAFSIDNEENKKIIRLEEIGENKLRHKREITLFTDITLC